MTYANVFTRANANTYFEFQHWHVLIVDVVILIVFQVISSITSITITCFESYNPS